VTVKAVIKTQMDQFAPSTALTTFGQLMERYMIVSTEDRNATRNFKGGNWPFEISTLATTVTNSHIGSHTRRSIHLVTN
jgi:hypothetical protein